MILKYLAAPVMFSKNALRMVITIQNGRLEAGTVYMLDTPPVTLGMCLWCLTP
jgi:hypothetical protein